MSPETFLALVTLGSTAFTFSAGFIAGRAWAAWRVRRQAAALPDAALAAAPQPARAGGWTDAEVEDVINALDDEIIRRRAADENDDFADVLQRAGAMIDVMRPTVPAPAGADAPILVTVGATHQCRYTDKIDICVHCGAMADELSKPCKAWLEQADAALAAAPQPVDLVNDSFAVDWLTNRAELHPETARLVVRFARALAGKLAAAEKKYGYSDGWLSPDWMDECRTKLIEHIAKGDPRDVAAYCAFLWHHGAGTAAAQPAASAAPPDAEPCRPDILERLRYHQLERDDLTIDECWSYLAQRGWKEVHGRTTREMVLQILSLLAAAPAAPAAVDSNIGSSSEEPTR